MKVSLSEQLEEATRYRDALERLHDEGVKFTQAPDLETRLHRAEGIVLTLTFNQTYEAEWRAFMDWRKSRAKD